MRKQIPTLLILISCMGLGACTSSAKRVMKTDTTMEEVIDGLSGNNYEDSRSRVSLYPTASSDRATYTRTAESEIENLFSKIPNPDLQMFVYPHLTNGGLAIPGYSVVFSMYDKDHYALPGEVIDPK